VSNAGVFAILGLAPLACVILAACGGSQSVGSADAGNVDASHKPVIANSDASDSRAPKEDVAVADARLDSDAAYRTDASETGADARTDAVPGCLSGATCTPSNSCDVGTVSCASGKAVCTDTGLAVPDGTLCGQGSVCSAGQCGFCSSGAACVPSSNACHQGTIQCGSGSPVCNDTGTNAADGTPCGTGLACSGGQCTATVGDAAISVSVGWCNVQWPPQIPDEASGIPLPRAGATVTWPGQSAAIYARVFAPGVTTTTGNESLIVANVGFGPVGSDPTNPAQASEWSWQPMAYNATCSACGQNYEYESDPTAPASPGMYAYAARFSGNGGVTFAYCAGNAGTSSGQPYASGNAPVMTVAGPGCQDVGAACGFDTDCCAGSGSCVDSLCTCPGSGQSCVPNNVCDVGAIGCPTDATPSCVDTGLAVAHGTPCGSGQCSAGSCSCAPNCAGLACGATDGCGGRCLTGSCASGLMCTGGACVCDSTSCPSGCCSVAGECVAGTSGTACGKGGDACVTCNASQACSSALCVEAGTGTVVLYGGTAPDAEGTISNDPPAKPGAF